MQGLKSIINKAPYIKSISVGKFIFYPFGDPGLPFFAPNKNTDYLVGITEENLGKTGPEQLFYKMADDEIYIVAGLTPPECLYYGFIQYLFKREDQILFASACDTLNNSIVNYFTNRTYKVPILIMISKNPRILNTLYDFLSEQEIIPVPYIYKVALPSEKFKPDDIFVSLFRIANLADGNDSFQEDTKLEFLKVKINQRVNDPTNKYCFYAVGEPIVDNPTCKNGFFQKPRDSNIDEYSIQGLLSGFNIYTQTVLNNINEQKNLYTSKGNSCKKNKCRGCDCCKKRKPNGPIIIIPPTIPPGFVEITSRPWGFFKDGIYNIIDTGYNCIDNNVDCVGDNRDTTYRISDVIFTDNIDYIVITGINHVMTGKSLYTNINVYDDETQEALFNLDITTPDTLYYYIILTKDALKKSDGKISKKVFTAERAYLQRFISPSYETTIPYKIFINTIE